MKKLLNCLFVTNPSSKVFLENENVVVKLEEEILIRVPLITLENIVIFNYFGASSAFMAECARRNITVSFLNEYGKYLGTLYGETRGNVLVRREQFRIADDKARAVKYAKNFTFAKLHNQKWVIERCIRDHAIKVDVEVLQEASHRITAAMQACLECDDMNVLRALEGNAAQAYFSGFDQLILQNKAYFVFAHRNRRPPLDAVNAMLSFAYSLLASECRHALEAVGLDSYVGFMHVDRPGRASLALDLMEELRAHFADRFVLSLINRKEISESDFDKQESGAVLLKDGARKKFLAAWQQHKREEILHPFLGEKCQWGLVPYLQALILCRVVRGDLKEYPPFLWK